MERRRFGLPASGRGRAGVAALVAGALGIGLLAVPLFDDPGATASAPGTKKATTSALSQDTAQEKAVASGKRVEVTSLRDETSTTYARPDGSFELVAYGAPVRAKVNGTWKPIDTTLARTEEGWAPKATAEPVVFSAGGSGGSAQGGRTSTTVNPAVFTVATGGGAVQAADASEGFSERAPS